MKKSAYLTRLKADLERWSDAGWIADSLSRKLYADAAAQSFESDRNTPILPGLAGLAVMIGILTVIAANWSSMSGIARLGLYFVLFAAFLFAAAELRIRRMVAAANIFATIAAALAGAGLVVIGQLYHTSATTAAFLSTWALLAGIVALLLRSPLAAAGTAFLVIWWIGIFRLEVDGAAAARHTLLPDAGPTAALPFLAAIGLYAWTTRTLALVHLLFIGAALWLSPALYEMTDGAAAYWVGYLTIAAFWGAVGAGFELAARAGVFWGARTLSGWSAWTASGALVATAGALRFVGHHASMPSAIIDFAAAILILIIFCVLTAYGAASGRRWIRGAGVAGFIAAVLVYFFDARNLLTSGLLLIAFGVALSALIYATGAVARRNSARGGAS